MFETIVALSSAQGNAAIAVIRMSGDNAFEIFSKASRLGEPSRCGVSFEHWRIKRFHLFDANGEVIDDCLAAFFVAPKSFTGENVVEIYCHGSQIVASRIIKRTLELGAKTAGKGEFTKRAFLNGKIDLHKAEAINAMVSANDYYSHKNAVAQYMGQGREFFDEIRDEVQNLLADVESAIEFSETDELNGDQTKIYENLTGIAQKIAEQCEKYARTQKIKNGIPTVLVGRTNAGKSSLFNCLLGENRTIVNEKAGTTRDVISETVRFEDCTLRLCDTAGLNETGDEIENEGILRTKAEIKKAFVALWVLSPDDEEFESDYELLKKIDVIIAVLNKSDVGRNERQARFLREEGIEYVNFSTLRDCNVQNIILPLRSQIKTKFPDNFSTVLASVREAEILRRILEIIEEAKFETGEEILAQYLREILKTLGEIYGFIAPDEILNKIFDSFCIGK